MEYYELMHDFIDGSLDGHKEQELFIALSNNDELRNELKQQLAIKEAIKTDKLAYTPTVESTMKIFSTLGFNSPAGAVTQIPKHTLSDTLRHFWIKYSQGIIATLATGTIAAVIILSLLKYNGDSIHTTGNGSPNTNNYAQNQQNSNQSKIPFISSSNNDNKNNNDNTKTVIKTVTKYILVKENTNNLNRVNGIDTNNNNANNNVTLSNENKNIKEEAPLPKQEITELSKSDINQNDYANNNLSQGRNFSTSNFTLLNKNDLLNLLNNENTKFSVEFRGQQYWNFPNGNASPDNMQAFNNTAIAVFYTVTDEFSLGFDYRRENFYQKYEGLAADGKYYNFEQQPNFSSYSLAIRYLPDQLKFSFLQPFIQTTLGATDVGKIGRIMLGTEIAPYANISFVVGFEASTLRYHHNQYNFLSNKAGLNFGAKIKL